MKTTNNKKKLFLGLVSVIKTLIFFLLSKYIKKDYWSHNNMDHGGNTTNCTVCVDFLPVQISSRVCNIFLWYSYSFDEHNQRHEKGFKNVLVFFGNRILRLGLWSFFIAQQHFTIVFESWIWKNKWKLRSRLTSSKLKCFCVSLFSS